MREDLKQSQKGKRKSWIVPGVGGRRGLGGVGLQSGMVSELSTQESGGLRNGWRDSGEGGGESSNEGKMMI